MSVCGRSAWHIRSGDLGSAISLNQCHTNLFVASYISILLLSQAQCTTLIRAPEYGSQRMRYRPSLCMLRSMWFNIAAKQHAFEIFASMLLVSGDVVKRQARGQSHTGAAPLTSTPARTDLSSASYFKLG